ANVAGSAGPPEPAAPARRHPLRPPGSWGPVSVIILPATLPWSHFNRDPVMNRRRVLIALAVVALAVVAIAGAVLLLLPRDRIAALAAERAEAVLGREVRIEAVDVDFFPRPAVALEGVAIAGAEPDAPPFAT